MYGDFQRSYRVHCIRFGLLIESRQLPVQSAGLRGDTMRILVAPCLCALALSAPEAIFGQAVYGSISGNVTDSSGSAVPNGKVVITDTGKGITNNTTTNESGNY